MTQVQRDNAWRLARQFMVTSTVAEEIFRLLLKYKNDYVISSNDCVNLLSSKIGMSISTGYKEISNEFRKYLSMSKEDLQKLNMTELKPVATAYGQKCLGNKKDVI